LLFNWSNYFFQHNLGNNFFININIRIIIDNTKCGGGLGGRFLKKFLFSRRKQDFDISIDSSDLFPYFSNQIPKW
jgi:hypothetical protein